MWTRIKKLFRKKPVAEALSQSISQVTPLRDLVEQSYVLLGTLRDLGDDFVKLEPSDLGRIKWVADAADAAQFISGVTEYIPGLQKAAAVFAALRLGWKSVNATDDKIDAWWISKGRPFLDKYVEKAKALGYYEKSV